MDTSKEKQMIHHSMNMSENTYIFSISSKEHPRYISVMNWKSSNIMALLSGVSTRGMEYWVREVCQSTPAPPYRAPLIKLNGRNIGILFMVGASSVLFDMYYGNKSMEKAKADIQQAWYKKYLKLISKGLTAHDHDEE